MAVATLLVNFRMLKIERYASTRCPYILLKLYSIVMRAFGLDEHSWLLYFHYHWVRYASLNYPIKRLGRIWHRSFWDGIYSMMMWMLLVRSLSPLGRSWTSYFFFYLSLKEEGHRDDWATYREKSNICFLRVYNLVLLNIW